MYNTTMRRPAGAIIITDPEGTIQYDTFQCCHCNQHTPVMPAPNEQYGFCPRCNGVTCASKKCHKHYPFEKKLDDYEKGKLRMLG